MAMKTRSILIVLALAAMLALSVGLSAAQGPHPTLPTGTSGGEPQTLVGSAFTYQGHLKKGGNPVNATCDMAFRLYDDATAGNLQGLITTTVTVEGGLFTVLLDFGEGPFTGEARFLEIAVQCPGDAAFNTLSPRQELTAAPYALSLRPGAAISGAVSDGAILYALNTDTEAALFAYGLMGRVSSTKGYGVVGHANALSGETYGVYGRSDSTAGRGVYGLATATSGENYGVYGSSASAQGTGVCGLATATGGTTFGVYGRSDSPIGYGVVGSSIVGTGVYGYAGANSGENAGVYGRSDSTAGHGVYGWALATSGNTYGVYGRADSPAGHGVHGVGERGVYGVTDSTTGRGVVGYATATSGDARGVAGYSDSTGGIGVYGRAGATAGTTYGVYGRSDSPQGVGVYGYNSSSTDGVGVYGVGPNAVIGISSSPGYAAIYGRNQATTGEGMGVYGRSDSSSGSGVYGYATAAGGTANGVEGISAADQGTGVYGRANGTTALANGVLGESYYGLANGVSGIVWTTTGTGVGVFGQTHSPSGYAGYFSGNVHVNGTFTAVNKLFKIDHPLDPANKYLYHYSVESAEVLNQYSGNVVLGADGSAWVELPSWFGALNRDVRYLLTPIGAPAPGLYIAQEIRDNRFQIAGGPPGLKVSWLITAVRNDPYIQRYGAPVEVEKPEGERGTYLYPEGYGQPRERGYDYRFNPGRPAEVSPAADLPAVEVKP